MISQGRPIVEAGCWPYLCLILFVIKNPKDGYTKSSSSVSTERVISAKFCMGFRHPTQLQIFLVQANLLAKIRDEEWVRRARNLEGIGQGEDDCIAPRIEVASFSGSDSLCFTFCNVLPDRTSCNVIHCGLEWITASRWSMLWTGYRFWGGVK